MDKKVWMLFLFLAAVAFVAFTGSRFMPGDWYETLVKPPWNPPNWLFGPVWTLLYLGIAVAGWLVWRDTPHQVSLVLGVWVAQLVLNAAWSWLFFGLHRPGLALIDITLMLVSIIAFALMAWPINTTATWLFIPYGVWVAYAASLNLYIWHFNPASGSA